MFHRVSWSEHKLQETWSPPPAQKNCTILNRKTQQSKHVDKELTDEGRIIQDFSGCRMPTSNFEVSTVPSPGHESVTKVNTARLVNFYL